MLIPDDLDDDKNNDDADADDGNAEALVYNRSLAPPPPPQGEFLPGLRKSLLTIHVLYFWKALGTRDSMTMLWGVRHANTQSQRQRQRQIHLGPEVESHYRPYMCYIFGKPWVQGTQ